MTCVWYHIKPYDILFPKIHEAPKVLFSSLHMWMVTYTLASILKF